MYRIGKNKNQVLGWHLATGVYEWLLLCILLPVVPSPWVLVCVLIIAFLAVATACHISYSRHKLQAHTTSLYDFARQKDWPIQGAMTDLNKPTGYIGSLGRFYHEGAIQILCTIEQQDWSYREIACTVTPLFVGASLTYRLAVVYYAVIIIKLPDNSLPNVFLAAHPQHPRQHRIHFSKSKQISVTELLAQYFTVSSPDYAEQNYSIFTRPALIETFIASANYDIEIKAGRLYLYDKLGDPFRQILDMLDKAMAIRDALASTKENASS